MDRLHQPHAGRTIRRRGRDGKHRAGQSFVSNRNGAGPSTAHHLSWFAADVKRCATNRHQRFPAKSRHGARFQWLVLSAQRTPLVSRLCDAPVLVLARRDIDRLTGLTCSYSAPTVYPMVPVVEFSARTTRSYPQTFTSASSRQAAASTVARLRRSIDLETTSGHCPCRGSTTLRCLRREDPTGEHLYRFALDGATPPDAHRGHHSHSFAAAGWTSCTAAAVDAVSDTSSCRRAPLRLTTFADIYRSSAKPTAGRVRGALHRRRGDVDA